MTSVREPFPSNGLDPDVFDSELPGPGDAAGGVHPWRMSQPKRWRCRSLPSGLVPVHLLPNTPPTVQAGHRWTFEPRAIVWLKRPSSPASNWTTLMESPWLLGGHSRRQSLSMTSLSLSRTASAMRANSGLSTACIDAAGSTAATSTPPSSVAWTMTLQGSMVPILSSAWSA